MWIICVLRRTADGLRTLMNGRTNTRTSLIIAYGGLWSIRIRKHAIRDQAVDYDDDVEDTMIIVMMMR